MRITSVSIGSNIQCAVEVEGRLYAWSDVVPGRPASTVLDALPYLCDGSLNVSLNGAEPLPEGKILAPIPHPRRNLFCLGKNYAKHAEEFNTAMDLEELGLPSAPIVFTKATSTVGATGETVYVDPAVTSQVDYEGELAVVIGRKARKVRPEEVYDYVAGYTLLNDLTARDLQSRHQQWFVGKSLDGFAPMGPMLVSKDEIPEPTAVRITTVVDGETRQQAQGDEMIFDIPYVISFLSQVMTLQPGDIIAMGTPDGVGIGFNPPKFLEDGSHIQIEAEEIGRLETTVRFTA